MNLTLSLLRVPDLTSEDSTRYFAKRLAKEVGKQQDTGILVIDFAHFEPSPTRYDALADVILAALKDDKRLLLTAVSGAVIATSLIAQLLRKHNVSLPFLDKDRHDRLRWLGKRPARRVLAQVQRSLGSIVLEIERSKETLSTVPDIDLDGAIRETGALLHGHFVLPDGNHSHLAVDINRLLDRPEILALIEMKVGERFRDGSLDGLLTSSHSATLNSLVARISVKLAIPDQIRIFEEYQHFSPELSAWSKDKTLLIVTDIVRSGSWLQNAVSSIQGSGGEVVGAVVLLQHSGITLKLSHELEDRLLILHRTELDFVSSADCTLCMQGIPYREISRRDQSIAAEYAIPWGTKRRFRKGLPLIPSEFWQLVQASGCFMNGHIFNEANRDVHYDTYFDLPKLFGRYGQLIASRIVHFLQPRFAPSPAIIITPEGEAAKQLGTLVAEQFPVASRPECVHVSSLAMETANQPGDIAARLGAATYDKLRQRLSQPGWIVIDDGMNFGYTMSRLHELIRRIRNTGPDLTVVFLNRCRHIPAQLKALLGETFFYCYAWPAPPYALVNRCPIDEEYALLKAFSQGDDALPPLKSSISQRMMDLSLREPQAVRQAEALPPDMTVTRRLAGDGVWWDDLTLDGRLLHDELNMLGHLLRSSIYRSVYLPIAIEVLTKGGWDELLKQVRGAEEASLLSIAQALTLQTDYFEGLSTQAKERIAMALAELTPGRINESLVKAVVAITKCSGRFCVDLMVRQCLEDQNSIPPLAVFAASQIFSEEPTGYASFRADLFARHDEFKAQENEVNAQRIATLVEYLDFLRERTGLHRELPAHVDVALGAHEEVTKELAKLKGASYGQILSNVKYSQEVLSASATFLDSRWALSEAAVVFCGSFGRLEAGMSSDGDFFIIDMEGSDFTKAVENHWPLFRSFANWLVTEKKIEVSRSAQILNDSYRDDLFPDKGIFPTLSTRASLLHKLGTQLNVPEVRTRRMALLLESIPVKEPAAVFDLKALLLQEYGLLEDATQAVPPWRFMSEIQQWHEETQQRAEDQRHELLWLKWGFQRRLLCKSTILAIGGLMAEEGGKQPPLKAYLHMLSKPPVSRLQTLLELDSLKPARRRIREAISPIVSATDEAMRRYGDPKINRYLKTGETDASKEIEKALVRIRRELTSRASEIERRLEILHELVKERLNTFQQRDFARFL